MAAALGESVRTRRAVAAEALERAELAERTREEEARSRVDAERLRIAREVHDTVAHAIAIINVQAGVTAYMLDKRRSGRARRWRPSSRPAPRRCTRCVPSSGCFETRRRAGTAPGPRLRSTNSPRRPVKPDSTSGQSRLRRAAPAGRGGQRRLPDPAGVAHQRDPPRRADPGDRRARLRTDALRVRVADEGRGRRPPMAHRSANRAAGSSECVSGVELLGGDLDAGPRPTAGSRSRRGCPWPRA